MNTTNNPLTHLTAQGTAHMVDVSHKQETARTAHARGQVRMARHAYEAVATQAIAKGDVLGVARIAGIQAAKRTAELIPLCHPLNISRVLVELHLDDALPGVRVEAIVKTTGPTGVEMEALSAVSVACLTLYDMVKALDKAMVIEGICLLEKTGGKSGDWQRS
jgi:cyclic pyranopterin monophosphate synthase